MVHARMKSVTRCCWVHSLFIHRDCDRHGDCARRFRHQRSTEKNVIASELVWLPSDTDDDKLCESSNWKRASSFMPRPVTLSRSQFTSDGTHNFATVTVGLSDNLVVRDTMRQSVKLVAAVITESWTGRVAWRHTCIVKPLCVLCVGGFIFRNRGPLQKVELRKNFQGAESREQAPKVTGC